MYLDDNNMINAKLEKINGEYKLIVENVSTMVVCHTQNDQKASLMGIIGLCRKLFTADGVVRLSIKTRSETDEDIEHMNDRDIFVSYYDTVIYDTPAYPGDFIAESYLEIDKNRKVELKVEIRNFSGSGLETIFDGYCDMDSNFNYTCPDEIKKLGKEYEKMFESSVEFNLDYLRHKGGIE